ncbi:MAG: hypothetical protein ACI91F_003572 [Candidatus Binatia bacterium]|jgi:hypothetical protein
MTVEPAPIEDIESLVERNPGQMVFDEYCTVWDEIARKRPCRLLVFGCGNDSGLWLRANHGGYTMFVEHNREWSDQAAKNLAELPYSCDFDIKVVNYSTMLHHWRRLLERPRRLLLPSIENHWDVVLVDGRLGIGWRAQGRIRSIYTASRVACSNATIMVARHGPIGRAGLHGALSRQPTRALHKLSVWRRDPHNATHRNFLKLLERRSLSVLSRSSSQAFAAPTRQHL